ncbi:NlpC/P60 family protein [Bacteroidota bacterium]
MDKLLKGVCRLSVVPVRRDPEDQSEIVTQLLFGDHYSIMETHENEKWLKINIYIDNYMGWIDNKQHTPISNEYFDEINKKNLKITVDKVSEARCSGKTLLLVAGSILPISDNELFKGSEIFNYFGKSKSLGDKRGIDFLKQTALSYLDTPYLWGGKTPFGIDCSGFTQMVFKLCGYPIFRDASEQFNQGIVIKNLADALPGDLAFFKNQQDQIAHVGIIIDTEKIIHAYGQVRIDNLDEKGIFRKDFNKHTHILTGIRRILR